MWVDRMLDSHCDCKLWPHPWPWPWIFKVKYWKCCNLGIGGSTHVEWKGCELDMMLDAQWDWPWVHDHGAWQLDQPSNGSMWNSYSFQPVGQWMGYSFTDLGAEGCCRSLNALFINFLTIHLLISLGTLLARKNIEGMVWSFSNLACRCI